VLLGDVADQLLDDHRLAHAGAAEHAHLAALGEGCDEVDHLQSGLEYLGGGGLLIEGRRRAVDRVRLAGIDRPLVVDRLAQHVENAPESRWADGHADWPARVDDLRAPRQAVGSGHRNGAHPVVAEVLLNLADDPLLAARDLHGVEDLGQLAGRELDVDDRSGDLDDLPGSRLGGGGGCGRHGRSCLLARVLSPPGRRSRSRSSRG
jgi:hypothetical protein